MRENRLRTLWAAEKPAVNSWLTIPDAFCAEILAHAGFDSLTVDMQHGLIGFETAVSMLTAISSTATVPVVRVPGLDPAMIMKVLDAGAYGVICPLVNTRADAERFVTALRYPPAGNRSFGPNSSAALWGPRLCPSCQRCRRRPCNDRNLRGA